MTKHCGLSRLFAFLVAALFCLTLAAPQSRADSISVGTGILNLCWNGVSSPCDFPGDQPNVSLTDPDGNDQVSIHISGNPNQDTNLQNPLLLIFATPVENLLFPFGLGGPTNGFSGGAGNVTDVRLYEGYNPNSGTLPLPLPLPAPSAFLSSTFPIAGDVDYLGGGTLFLNQGQLFNETHDNFYNDYLAVSGVAGGTDSKFDDWAKEMYDTPAWLVDHSSHLDGLLTLLGMDADEFKSNLLGDHPSPCDFEGDLSADCVTGFNIWIYELTTSNGAHAFGTGDTINVVTNSFPLGTIVTAYGVQNGCNLERPTGGCVLAPPNSKIAILMAIPSGCTEEPCIPQIPEPTSLLLLGTGLLGIGRQWRKRQNQKKAEKQNVT